MGACKEGGVEGVEGDEVRRERRAAGETGAAAPGGTGTAAAVGGAAAVGDDAAAASATGVAEETVAPDGATGITFSFPGRRGRG